MRVGGWAGALPNPMPDPINPMPDPMPMTPSSSGCCLSCFSFSQSSGRSKRHSSKSRLDGTSPPKPSASRTGGGGGGGSARSSGAWGYCKIGGGGGGGREGGGGGGPPCRGRRGGGGGGGGPLWTSGGSSPPWTRPDCTSWPTRHCSGDPCHCGGGGGGPSAQPLLAQLIHREGSRGMAGGSRGMTFG